MWRYTPFKKSTKIVISLVFAIFFVLALTLPDSDSDEESNNSTQQHETKESNKVETPASNTKEDTKINNENNSINNNDSIVDNSEDQTIKLRNSVETELHLGKVEELGQFDTNTNILISVDNNLTENMTKKTINRAIAQTLIGINNANTGVKSANIGVKIGSTRVVSSKWNEDAIKNIEKYKNEIYDNPAQYADSFNKIYK
ncbi:hypothetical protein RJB87_01890 [Staphylococcus hominis]|uniref:Uncharacterized protein n=1 Tax=Staphylococcus hominis TaxID=1290 RepID=A0A6N0I3Y9_STAHO|nr:MULTISPECIES: hypothetical protein [Staphylococcus]MDS3904003.1 hypothetical protein [Staphylococcus hominis]QKQ29309.1 hypothetical protein FOB69_09775 [Staphylococcus hominis]TBW92297.1 hypothetical protein EQ808_03140 [Staphylococcus hominis]TRL64261.1 hypothetical protein FNL08_00185 [Staphylococcus hominis]UNQ67275.1 hypothetical protein MOV58_07795 [Staphylococcus hominis]